ncbi:MAG: lysine biosynthesis protein LysW [Mycobacterium sp.]|nr:MAG: lysine biosynthesis protein LysW [Mycobacterium sp.]
MTSSTTQTCSTEGCSNPAAFGTRTKPSWCATCIDEILRVGGMRGLEPVAKANAFTLMECLTCGTRAHHKLDYVVGNNSSKLATCRACHWRDWAAMQRSHLQRPAPSIDDARAHAEAHGYEYLGPLTSPSLADDPHHVRCRQCQKLSAERLGDIGFGCACSRNGKSASKATVSTAKARQRAALFKDSGTEALTWWDHTVNSQADFDTASKAATRVVAWVCPTCSCEFTCSVREMVEHPQCPSCEDERRAAWRNEYDALKATAVADHPMLAAAWDDPADPRRVPIAGGWELRRFRCTNGHRPRISPYTFLQSGCPHCRSAETRKSKATSTLAQEHPEVAAQWHPTRNGKLTPDAVVHTSKRSVWWRDAACGHEWEESVRDRNKYQRYLCPQCRTILDSLAYQFPLLANEWSPRNPVTAWHVRPNGTTLFAPEWVCSNDPTHLWIATLTSRTNGSDCPECRETGKSKVELDHLAAANEIFGKARSGVKLRSIEFTRRPTWTADITVPLPDSRTLVIEYDGGYWHKDKVDIDRAKSLDLVAGGYRVVRLREHPLRSLEINDPRYSELVVYATAPDPQATAVLIKELIEADAEAWT